VELFKPASAQARRQFESFYNPARRDTTASLNASLSPFKPTEKMASGEKYLAVCLLVIVRRDLRRKFLRLLPACFLSLPWLKSFPEIAGRALEPRLTLFSLDHNSLLL
jgi:hypothetical protein